MYIYFITTIKQQINRLNYFYFVIFFFYLIVKSIRIE